MHKIKFIVLAFSCMVALTTNAQQEEAFFKKENVFTGGTANLGFGNQQTILGASPCFGYSLNKYVDVAAVISFNYTSIRDYNPPSGDKLRQKLYGPGAFVRLFPAKFLFAQAQYEFNMIRYNYIPSIGSGNSDQKLKFDAHSFLVGAGISNGKDFPEQKSYYYFSVLWDVAKSPFSPYIDQFKRSVPIFRAGYNIALFQGK